MEAHGLAYSNGQSCQRPAEPCVVVAPDKDKEEDESLQHDQFGGNQKLGFGKGLL